MKILLFLCIWLVGVSNCDGQNLVTNPGFEDYGTLPCSWITSPSAFINAMNDWILPTHGTSDVFSILVPASCWAHGFSTNQAASGYQAPRSGDVMAAFHVFGNGDLSTDGNYREYLEVQLTTPLTPGLTYKAEMYVSLFDNHEHATNNIGMYFSDNLITDYTHAGVLPYTPQVNETNIITDTLNWVLISGTFTATSSFQYLIIGNFFDSASTSLFATGNGTFNLTNTMYYIDDVSVSLYTGLEESDLHPTVSVFPNPVLQNLNISVKEGEKAEVSLFDITARKIYNNSFVNSISINTGQFTKGIYFYEVRFENGTVKKGKIVKD